MMRKIKRIFLEFAFREQTEIMKMQLERIKYLQSNIDILVKDNNKLSYITIQLRVAEALKKFLQKTQGKTDKSTITISSESKMISDIKKYEIENSKDIFNRIRMERNSIAHPTEEPDLSNSTKELRDIYSFIQKNSQPLQ